jgi:hypothetical protein
MTKRASSAAMALAVVLCFGICLAADDFYVIPVAPKAVCPESKWVVVHGSQGRISGTTTYQAIDENGLSFEPASGTEPVSVHFSVPSLFSQPSYPPGGGDTYAARYIKLKFAIWTVNPCEWLCPWISTITVRNGDVVVKTFSVDWFLTNPKTETLDLGSNMVFPDGMLISVTVERGQSDMGIFSFYSAGAYFIRTSL